MNKKMLLMSCLAFTITVGCKDQSYLKNKPKNSEYVSQQITSFLVQHNLKKYHFKQGSTKDQLVPAYLETIDPGKMFLLKSQLKTMNLDSLMLKLDTNIPEIAAISKKYIDINCNKVINHLKKITVTFDVLKNNTKFTLAREDSSFFNTNKEFISYWENFYLYSIASSYLDLLKENELESKKLTDKEEEDYQLQKLIYDKEALNKAKDKSLKKLSSLITKFLDKNIDDYVSNVLNAISHTYDIHSGFIPPKNTADFDTDLNGRMEGIGAVLRDDEGEIIIESVVPGGAAWKSDKVEKDDIILSVKDMSNESVKKNLSGLDISDAVKLIKGPKGTKVELTLKKSSGKLSKVILERDIIEIAETYVKHGVIQKNNKKYGYIYVPKFYRDFRNPNARNCSDDVKKALLDFKKESLSGVILDLRNNGGGALEDARIMSGLFIDSGPIVNIKNSFGQVHTLKDTDGKTYYKGNLVVLVNTFSASASEIVAAALQDYNRAVVIGSKQTHGKGTVQVIQDLTSDSIPFSSYVEMIDYNLGKLKITTQKFYRISGDTTQYNGVVPNIIIPEANDYEDSLEKSQKFSLKPDKIHKEKYSTILPEEEISNLVMKSNKRISSNEYFGIIKEMNLFFREQDNRKNINYNLKNMFDRIKKKESKLKVLTSKLDKFKQDYTVSIDKKVLFPNISNKDLESSKFKKRASKEIESFKESLEKDLTIAEALNVINEMKSN